jgi:signal transduction histidine kinase
MKKAGGSPDILDCSVTAADAGQDQNAQEKVRVLIVDDQPENLLSVEAVLERLGEEIVTASSGHEALRRLLEHDVAVIVLDVMMPDMDGFETAALIRERERSRLTPIIFLTALGMSEEHVFRGYGAGAVDFMAKPFAPEVLRSKVAVFVELHRKTLLLEKRNAELQESIAKFQAAEQEVQKLNRHLERRLEELAALNSEMESFSYSVSHDLRGPLARISGFSRALLEHHAASLNDEGKLYLRRIGAAAEKTTQLVDDLLKLSRLTRAELRLEPVDLSGIARSLAADLESRDPHRRVEIRIAPEALTYGDPNLLRAALANLLENAWKFTGRVENPVIEFGVAFAGGRPIFHVKDNGAGFDMAAADKLFTPFQRLHSSSEFQGTGIGLATVDRIIRRHGGRIWAEAAVDRGAAFYFTLPGKAVI